MAIRARKLHPAIGAEVTGVDLSQDLDAATIGEIGALWSEHLVLVFPGQSLTEARQIAFTKNFGELDVTVEDDKKSSKNPEVLRIGNVDEQGRRLAADHPIPRYFSTLTSLWHTDGSYRAVPSHASMLHALEVTPEGGETCFANAIAAYEALPQDMKQRIAGKHMVHSYEFTRHLTPDLPPLSEEERSNFPPATHPLVRIHADGRKSLYVSGNVAYYVGGMPLEEGRKLHAWLLDWVTQPRFVYEHHWTVGDVVLWDNRPTLHRVLPYDPRHRRVLQRTEIKGTEIPVG
ncbi:MAG TPA: TauD/TfdA family dioxygenase [Alphaproteobacteria bacterium]|nr:TauD/TfdA family dioxygenase [Alphaproteobacteria bacterium]